MVMDSARNMILNLIILSYKNKAIYILQNILKYSVMNLLYTWTAFIFYKTYINMYIFYFKKWFMIKFSEDTFLVSLNVDINL